MKILINLLVTAATLILVTYIVPGIHIDSFLTACIAALVLGVLNVLVRPVLIVLTLPVTILALGIFIFIINASLFLFVASFVDGFVVESFWAALFGSLLTSIISSLLQKHV
ncbi:MAG: phage holin family protein [Minisyncoccia bacterium]